jgi:hypothetical protein
MQPKDTVTMSNGKNTRKKEVDFAKNIFYIHELLFVILELVKNLLMLIKA